MKLKDSEDPHVEDHVVIVASSSNDTPEDVQDKGIHVTEVSRDEEEEADCWEQKDLCFRGGQESESTSYNHHVRRVPPTAVAESPLQEEEEEEGDDSCVREKLKRHRTEVAGRVWIPEIWGQEELLKDWTDCSAFDATLVSAGFLSARDALVRQGLRTTTHDPLGLSIGNSC